MASECFRGQSADLLFDILTMAKDIPSKPSELDTARLSDLTQCEAAWISSQRPNHTISQLPLPYLLSHPPMTCLPLYSPWSSPVLIQTGHHPSQVPQLDGRPAARRTRRRGAELLEEQNATGQQKGGAHDRGERAAQDGRSCAARLTRERKEVLAREDQGGRWLCKWTRG